MLNLELCGIILELAVAADAMQALQTVAVAVQDALLDEPRDEIGGAQAPPAGWR